MAASFMEQLMDFYYLSPYQVMPKSLWMVRRYIGIWEMAKLRPSLFNFRGYFTLRKVDD